MNQIAVEWFLLANVRQWTVSWRRHSDAFVSLFTIPSVSLAILKTYNPPAISSVPSADSLSVFEALEDYQGQLGKLKPANHLHTVNGIAHSLKNNYACQYN